MITAIPSESTGANDEQICTAIVDIITNRAFGPAISTNLKILQCLKESLPIMLSKMGSIQQAPGSFRIATEIASFLLKREGTEFEVLELPKTDERRVCFEAAYVLLFAAKRIGNTALLDMGTFLLKYPGFENESSDEKLLLLNFCNCMKVALCVIPAASNKARLLDIVTRIEQGFHQKYIPGGGETAATGRRVLIYETEGDIKKRPRPKKEDGANENGDVLSCGSGPKEAKKKKVNSTQLQPQSTTCHSSNMSSQHQIYPISEQNYKLSVPIISLPISLSMPLPASVPPLPVRPAVSLAFTSVAKSAIIPVPYVEEIYVDRHQQVASIFGTIPTKRSEAYRQMHQFGDYRWTSQGNLTNHCSAGNSQVAVIYRREEYTQVGALGPLEILAAQALEGVDIASLEQSPTVRGGRFWEQSPSA